MTPKTNRRNFVLSMSAGAAALTQPFFEREIQAQEASKPPMRLVVLQTPDGRPPEVWVPTGSETDFRLGSSLLPFESLKNDMVVMSGVDILRGEGEPHCQGFSTWMTGVRPHDTVDNYTAARAPSFDQVIAQEASIHGDRSLRSLQVAGDMSTVSFDISHRYMSWAGDDQPLPGAHDPLAIYQMLFAGLASGDSTAEKQAQLERTLKRRKSVLDFLERDWSRMAAKMPLAQRPNLEAHLEAIRALERQLSAVVTDSCKVPGEADLPPVDDFPRRYAANLELVKMALACDLTRIVTFMSSPTTSSLHHQNWIPEMDSDGHHHNLTHAGDVANLNLIGTWYSQQIAQFVQGLKDTPDGDGNLLDNTVVVYGSELGYGNIHTPENVPFLLFGNAQGQIRTGRYLNFLENRRSTNDLWVSVAQLMGLDWETFGDEDKNRGAVPGLVG